MIAIVIPTLDPSSEMVAQCREAITGFYDGRTVVWQHDEHREGFAVTCNRGAKEATDADVLVFLNDDTIPQTGWLDALVAPLSNPEVGICGARLTYPDGSLQHTGVLFRRTPLLEAYNRTTEADSGPVPAVTGACLAIRREDFDTLGGFDEAFRNGYEDVDLCLRAWTGLRLRSWYCADSNVVHLESQSPGRFDHVAHNVDLLQRRWGWLEA